MQLLYKIAQAYERSIFSGPLSDYLVINVSSPNTPGLRKLQGKQELELLISEVIIARNQYLSDKKPILVKIAPDLDQQDKMDIADLILNNPNCKIDGLIVSNTTISRPESLKSSWKKETGGLSGKPLKDLATRTISDMFKLTHGNYDLFKFFMNWKNQSCVHLQDSLKHNSNLPMYRISLYSFRVNQFFFAQKISEFPNFM